MNIHKPTQPATSGNATEARYVALVGVPMIKQGDDLAAAIVATLAASGERLCDDDVLILAQKIVSKAEGRAVRLDNIEPSAAAHDLAREVNKDPIS